MTLIILLCLYSSNRSKLFSKDYKGCRFRQVSSNAIKIMYTLHVFIDIKLGKFTLLALSIITLSLSILIEMCIRVCRNQVIFD